MSDTKPEQERPPEERIRFYFIKSNAFRVIHADGVWGGTTPHLGIHMAFYSERAPIPQQVVHRIKPDGRLGDEIEEERVSKSDIIREVEAEVLMDLATAKSFHTWLTEKIKKLEEFLRQKEANDVNRTELP